MKKTISVISLLLCLCTICCAVVACNTNTADPTKLWESATYRENITLGDGTKTIQVEIRAGDESITITLKTNAESLGAALLEHKLIEGTDGLYKKVNGMTADYNADQSYWGFFKNGEMMMIGLDDAAIADGEHYELVYTKQSAFSAV